MKFSKSYIRLFFSCIYACLLFCPIYPREAIKLSPSFMPEIKKLSHTDILFRQYSQVLEYNERESAAGRNGTEEFYTYRCSSDDDIYGIAAASGIPYDTLSSLNRISSVSASLKNVLIVLPAEKGVFVPEKPLSPLEIILSKEFAGECVGSDVRVYEIDGERFFFLSGRRFSSTQRAFFLDTAFRLPLDSKNISSGYGYRNSPVYGRWKFHKGIDFAAPEGDSVYACKKGVVAGIIKNDGVFGNYLILSHTGGLTSVYAHLSKILVLPGQVVMRGDVIGAVGQTGAATGPHLHFEIRQDGNATDPAVFFPKK